MPTVLTIHIADRDKPDLFAGMAAQNTAMSRLEEELRKDGCDVQLFSEAWSLKEKVRPGVGGNLSLFVSLKEQIDPDLVVIGVHSEDPPPEPPEEYEQELLNGGEYGLENYFESYYPIGSPKRRAIRLVKGIRRKSSNLEVALFSTQFDYILSRFGNTAGLLYAGGSSMSTVLSTCRGALGPSLEERTVIKRSLEFPPEFSQAGISLLSYFGNVVSQKYPEENVKVGIEQDGLKVTMFVETPEGEVREEVEKTLDEYSMVLKGDREADEMFSDPLQVLELKNQLRLAQTQLEQKTELLQHKREQSERDKERISRLEDRVDELYGMVGRSLERAQDQSEALIGTLDQLVSSSEGQVKDALSVVRKSISEGVLENKKGEVKEALEVIKSQQPGLFKTIFKTVVRDPITGAAGNILYNILVEVQQSLPP